MPPRIRLRLGAPQQTAIKTKARREIHTLLSFHPLCWRQPQFKYSIAFRNFSESPQLLKKGGKAAKATIADEKVTAEIDDAFDFSSLKTGIKDVHERLERGLQKLRTGGRFNPEILEGIRIHLVKDSKNSIRLGELAQVLPKGGRSIIVLVGEADHIKPIISAIQGSPELNLQPQQDAHNALQLNIPIPPPTKESRDRAMADANNLGEDANIGVRNARATMQKILRGMELKKTVRPDDLKRAHKEVEKLVEKGNTDAKKKVNAARKAMEHS